jgi:hypothetical protein
MTKKFLLGMVGLRFVVMSQDVMCSKFQDLLQQPGIKSSAISAKDFYYPREHLSIDLVIANNSDRNLEIPVLTQKSGISVQLFAVRFNRSTNRFDATLLNPPNFGARRMAERNDCSFPTVIIVPREQRRFLLTSAPMEDLFAPEQKVASIDDAGSFAIRRHFIVMMGRFAVQGSFVVDELNVLARTCIEIPGVPALPEGQGVPCRLVAVAESAGRRFLAVSRLLLDQRQFKKLDNDQKSGDVSRASFE